MASSIGEITRNFSQNILGCRGSLVEITCNISYSLSGDKVKLPNLTISFSRVNVRLFGKGLWRNLAIAIF